MKPCFTINEPQETQRKTTLISEKRWDRTSKASGPSYSDWPSTFANSPHFLTDAAK